MLPSQFAIEKKIISWMLVLILGVGGMAAFFSLGQLEDPPFTIKEARILVGYPGASAQQVEEEVTFPVEQALQNMSSLNQVTSTSSAGLSQISPEIINTYDGLELEQQWDSLRRRISDMVVRGELPPGTSEPLIIDDFGDVFGLMYAVTGEGYSYSEIEDFVDFLRRELVLVDGVARVDVSGARERQVFVEISQAKIAALGIPIQRIYSLLQTQNVVSNAGDIRAGTESVRINPTGEFTDVSQLEELLISEPGAQNLIYLGDVANVYQGFADVPSLIMRYGGRQALVVGLSFTQGVNVVGIGAAVDDKLASLEFARPVGMKLHEIYNQPREVAQSVISFLMNLIAAVAIVIVVLLFFMGVKSGILIGLILFLTCSGSFILMQMKGLELQRISLGALIIALGMLVDNAIVITEGVLIGMKRGLSKLQAANEIVAQTMWPLLGATVIAILAFAPIGLSPDSTGEFAGSLFWVLMFSLFLSWLTAMTITPFFCDLFFKEEIREAKASESGQEDAYKGFIFTAYRKLLDLCMRQRMVTVLLMVVLLAAAIAGFGNVQQSFFPPSTTPIFMVDFWLPEGTDIRATDEYVTEVQEAFAGDERIEFAHAVIGGGMPRFMLTYTPESSFASYAQLLFRVRSSEEMGALMEEVDLYLAENHPQATVKFKRLEIGPSPAAKIEARFIGPDPEVLRRIAAQAKAVFREDPSATGIRDDWRERTKMLRPQLNEANARRLGITKKDLDNSLLMSFSGLPVGLYRDGTNLMPILVRLPDEERLNIDSIRDIQLWSTTFGRYVMIDEVVNEFRTEWEDPLIQRQDRKRTLTVLADPDPFGTETAVDVFNRLRPKIEAIELPKGYELEWGGEYESSTDAQEAVFASLPIGFLAMFLITVLLFNAVRGPLVIWATVPLAIIGVTVGLLLLNRPFGFMALLGLLSLSGMLLKNGIVLLDQINTELGSGKDPYQAVIDSGVSRVRPVSMAAITTILGMVPLLADAFFESMAVTIMFGLGFATILTLVIVPVLYTLLHRIRYRPLAELEGTG
ncbi:MAG: efflux RND transporter permease subunit [Xanthomonadales bacterium]|nr:efflux RND transporter permease subunit [Xanthomonadales bacterium]